MNDDDRGRSEEGSEERRDDHRRKRFRYEETSSDSELNFLSQGENSKAALNVVWATVDRGAATSCLPVELCQEKGILELHVGVPRLETYFPSFVYKPRH